MGPYSPNVSAPQDVIASVVNLVERFKARRFVDAGCGDGNVLMAAAIKNRHREHTGIEIRPDLAIRTQDHAASLDLRNVRVIVGDLYRTLNKLNTDFVFCYLGAAHHQRVGELLRTRRSETVLVTALYPAFGLPELERIDGLSIPLFVYRPRASAATVDWDSPISVSIPREGGAQLTSLGATTYCSTGRLVVELRHGRSVGPSWVKAFIGNDSPGPGGTSLIDVLVEPPRGQAEKPPIVLHVSIRTGRRRLWPTHTLLVGSTRANPLDAKGPWSGLDQKQMTKLIRTSPARLIELVGTRPNSSPAA